MAAACVAPITEIPNSESEATQTLPIWATSKENWLRLLMELWNCAWLIGVSVRTLHKWEQRTSSPSGAAKTLLKIAATNPHAVREAAPLRVIVSPRLE